MKREMGTSLFSLERSGSGVRKVEMIYRRKGRRRSKKRGIENYDIMSFLIKTFPLEIGVPLTVFGYPFPEKATTPLSSVRSL